MPVLKKKKKCGEPTKDGGTMDINKIKNWVVKHDVEIAAGAVVVACGVACYIGYLSGKSSVNARAYFKGFSEGLNRSNQVFDKAVQAPSIMRVSDTAEAIEQNFGLYPDTMKVLGDRQITKVIELGFKDGADMGFWDTFVSRFLGEKPVPLS